MCNEFYEGVWFACNNMVSPETDHIDIRFYKAELPEDVTIEGLIEYFRIADEGGVVEEVVFEEDNAFLLRLIDMQAGPNFILPDARYQELKGGE